MKNAARALIVFFVALNAHAGAQFKNAIYELNGSCEFKCSASGVTNLVAQKSCKKIQASPRLYVSRDAKSVLIANADPRHSNVNQFRYAFGRHEGPSNMPSLQMTDNYILTPNTFTNVFESNYADGTQSKTVIRFSVLADGSVKKEELATTSGKFLGGAAGKVKSLKVCRYSER